MKIYLSRNSILQNIALIKTADFPRIGDPRSVVFFQFWIIGTL